MAKAILGSCHTLAALKYKACLYISIWYIAILYLEDQAQPLYAGPKVAEAISCVVINKEVKEAAWTNEIAR
jgi:hypothetical protein